MAATAAVGYKEAGNLEFKAGNWLKAAALYSKGLKEDPGNPVLLSNRSAALLKLHKVAKALADAEECIRCRPDWEKGWFRKANVLEATDKFDQALEAYQEAAKRSPDSKEVAGKVKALSRRVRAGGGQTGQPRAAGNGAISSSAEYESAKAGLSKAGGELNTASADDFAQRMLALVEEEIARRSFDRTFPAVFFQPGRVEADGSEKLGQVSVAAAFDSPDTLANAMGFLRQYAGDTGARAAVAVVPKHRIAYPQVWQKPGWPLGKGADGIFVQLEAPGVRRVWFMPLGQKHREPVALKDKFALIEALFR